jgi:deazaflavin-dependent oxidoreductase (nitroreductase family)
VALGSAAHGWLYRKTHGRVLGSLGGQPVMLLTTTGRRTGRARTTPVQFVRANEGLLIVAANHGARRAPAWYANLRTSPAVTVQIGDACHALRARVATGSERERLWAQLLGANPRLAKTQSRAGRLPPVVVLEPR